MRNPLRIVVLMLPPALALGILFILPMATMTLFSFRQGTFGVAREIFTFANYQEFLENRAYQSLLFRSTGIALETSLYAVLLAYPVAYYLSFRAGAKRMALLTILLVPAWTSYLLRILAWRLMLSSGGLLNLILQATGLAKEAQPILLYTRAAVIVTLVYTWIPFVALPIFAALERIDKSLLEAAADLGSPPWRSFWRITLPLSLPGVMAGFFFVFIPTLGEWVTPALVGGARGTMYGNAIQDQFVRGLNWPMGSLMSFVMLIFILLLTLILTRLVKVEEIAGV
jgi:spermidine/putrescine transport system permease protein